MSTTTAQQSLTLRVYIIRGHIKAELERRFCFLLGLCSPAYNCIFLKEVPGLAPAHSCFIAEGLRSDAPKFYGFLVGLSSYWILWLSSIALTAIVDSPTSDSVLVSFEDVFVSFTWEEWQVLDDAQRTLYREVMLETYSSLAVLGPYITKPVVILKLEQGADPWMGQESSNQCSPDVQKVDHILQPSHESQGRHLWQVVLTTNNTTAEERVELGLELKVLEWNFDLRSSQSSDLVIDDGSYSAMANLPSEPNGEKPNQYHITGKSLRYPEHFGQHPKIPTGQQDFQYSGQWERFTREAKLLKECVTYKRVPMGQACWKHDEPGKACEKSAVIATVGRKTLYKSCDLTTHETHTEEKSCECGECEKTFIVQQKKHSEKEPYSYYPHEESFSYKPVISMQQSFHRREKPYKCDECGEAFHTKSDLVRHESIHAWGKLFECKECGKTFCRKSSLTTHEKIHSGEKPHQCTKCRKAFRKKSQLRRHWRRIHTEEKLEGYECNECGKHFHRKSNLTKHRRTHTGEKPCECHQYGKCFGQKIHVTKHKTIHTSEKPYECNQCGKSFDQKTFLTNHQVIHTGERPYKCDECGKSFAYKSSLANHHMTHTREKPYGCNQCGKTFCQKTYLRKHERTQHSAEASMNPGKLSKITPVQTEFT
ncbi:zinc finger protein 717-like [Fukomys damarensis]|uniref:zinc finger protein 717-like n=1 Tax=Fukomys damarensis TaxID=885580 RepID=UPI0014558E3E|nr:zinc finger protein 717-like [Fukomys damarensis]